MKRVERTAIEQVKNLHIREERLYKAKWAQGTSPARRELILLAQQRIWRRLNVMSPLAIAEEQDLIWPNGLPAHP